MTHIEWCTPRASRGSAAFLFLVLSPVFCPGAGSTTTPNVVRPLRQAPAPFRDIRPGMSRFDAYAIAGTPSVRVTQDVWVYFDVWPTDPIAIREGYDAMMLKFDRDRLAEIRSVSGAAVKALMAATAASRATVAATGR